MYFDWESLFINATIHRQNLDKSGLSESEVVSRMNKMLDSETLLPPLSVPGIGAIGGGGSISPEGPVDNTVNSFVEDGYVEDYFE